jgi:hypothetical protein
MKGKRGQEGNKRGDRNECRNNEDVQWEAIPSVKHTGHIPLSSHVQGSLSQPRLFVTQNFKETGRRIRIVQQQSVC